jgi:hypothetical protein
MKPAMARPPKKLAQSLEVLRNLPTAEGAGAIRARDLSRTHRERLLRNGFLQEVIKGWYIPSRPDLQDKADRASILLREHLSVCTECKRLPLTAE